jgi:hypothetical protein
VEASLLAPTVALTGLLASLLGTGFGAKIAYRFLAKALEADFASKALEEKVARHSEDLHDHNDRLIRLEEGRKADAQVLTQLVVEPMRKMVERLDAGALIQERLTANLDSVTKAVQRLEERVDGMR